MSKKRRAQYPVAIAYFATMLICLIIFGLAAKFVVDKVTNDNSQAQSEAEKSLIPTADNNVTILFAMVDDSNKVENIALIRSLPADGKIVIIPFSPYTTLNGKTAADVYSSNGISFMRKEFETNLGIKIDKYMTVTHSSFDKLVSITSGVIYTATEDISYNNQKTTENIGLPKGTKTTLEGNQLRLVMNYPDYILGASTNVKTTGTILEDWINQSFIQSNLITENLDDMFAKLYDNADTNITTAEYKDQKFAIIYLINNFNSPAISLSPNGIWTGEQSFEVSSAFKDQLKSFLKL